MKARVKWVGAGVLCRARAAAATRWSSTARPEAGGRNLGMRPMEMVLAGRRRLHRVRRRLDPRSAPASPSPTASSMPRPSAPPVEPKVFTRIHLKYAVAGRGLDPHQVERAVKLSKEKYCSATIMLAQDASRSRTRYAIVDGGSRRTAEPRLPPTLSRSRRIRLDVSQRPPPRACTRA